MARHQPRRLGESLSDLLSGSAPRTLLADAQTAWPDAVGKTIAAASEPVAERQGRITIACATGAWAQELELMSDALRSRLEAIVGEDRITALRFTADLSRHR